MDPRLESSRCTNIELDHETKKIKSLWNQATGVQLPNVAVVSGYIGNIFLRSNVVSV